MSDSKKMDSLIIVKIGGNVINNQEVLDQVLSDFAQLTGPKILIHGGGRVADDLCRKMGIEPEMVNGRRITDNSTLDIVTMAYAGLINKKIVVRLQSHDCNAIGLTGADGNVLQTSKRPVGDIDYGFAGDVNPDQLDGFSLPYLIGGGLVPVMCSITHDKKGQLLNTNADTIASALAVNLSKDFKVDLFYCFEKKGVLLDPDNNNSMIEDLNEQTYNQHKKNGIISNGMIPKLDNAFMALSQGVDQVIICGPDSLGKKLKTGTVLCLR